ncbi:MAG: hypothetical protein K8R49_09080 [Candidatus Cloacimonetes bacterium]|nr:hypothetical protein [Candidatus Cloacimonadota bacterium]
MKMNKFLLIASALIIISLIILAACDKRATEPTGGGEGNDYYVMTIWAVPDTIYADDDNSTFSTISVLVKDRDDFIAVDKQVNFGSNLGSIIGFDPTDSTGVASVEFWDDGVPGLASIVASVDYTETNEEEEEVLQTITTQTQVMILDTQINPTTDVNSIHFDASGQVDINVAGTGGDESFTFQVSLKDVNGNLVEEPRQVYFKFVNAPEGTNLNNQVYWPSSDSVSVVSAGGHASVPINSGEFSGTASLKAYTYNSTGAEIAATKSNIVVHAGPPNSVDISIGGHDSGTDMGAGVWQIECSALITDMYGNPVDHETVVWFSLPDDPDWATIQAAAYIGNENASGDSLEGVAYTLLNYEGFHTNDSLIIQVETSGNEPGQSFIDQEVVIMPIQFPVIDMLIIPFHVDWDMYYNPSDWQGHDEETSPKVYVTVKDGQNNPINNQAVNFYGTLGVPVNVLQLDMPPTNPAFYEDFIDITGPDNDGSVDGEIIKYWRFYKYECPAPGLIPPGTTSGTLTAHILGTGITNQVTVVLNRYID